MDLSSAEALLALFDHIDLLLAVFVRFLGLIIIMPVFSGQNVPMMTKIMLAIALASIVLATGKADIGTYEATFFNYAIIILQEFLTGFLIGFIVYFFMSIFYFVGQLVDFQLGFSMVSVFDPVSQLQVPITGNMYYLMVCVFFVRNGGFDFFITTTTNSFIDIPIGGANILANSTLMAYMIEMFQIYLIMGVKISLPVVGTILIVDVALGVLVKAVPQMNVFVVGMPIKVLVGLVIVYMIVPIILDGFNIVILDAVKYTLNIIEGMSP